MAVRKLQVFLASRFDEFQELRLELKNRLHRLKVPAVEAVDLNDNAADPHPPLSRCYKAVDGAELFLLLVGDTYGTGLKDHAGKSYTHLEYKRALQDRSKTILVFLIGQSYQKRLSSVRVEEQPLRDWISEIVENHTPSLDSHGRSFG